MADSHETDSHSLNPVSSGAKLLKPRFTAVPPRASSRVAPRFSSSGVLDSWLYLILVDAGGMLIGYAAVDCRVSPLYSAIDGVGFPGCAGMGLVASLPSKQEIDVNRA